MRFPEPFEIMHWSKRRSERARFSLGVSGVPSPAPGELRFLEKAAREACGPGTFSSLHNYFGDPGLRETIAAIHGIEPRCVLVSDGTSLANYNALACLVSPGDRVLVEHPTYETLRLIPRFHGALVEDIPRRPPDWAPSIDAISAAVERGPVRAVVLSRLHNPSGAELPEGFLDQLASLAERHDFVVLVDEVYLDFLSGARPAHLFSDRFLSTGSVTKAYGFGGLRVGWILGSPDLLAPMKELSFYLAVNGATGAQLLARSILEHRDETLARSRGISTRHLAILREWMESRPDVRWVPPAGGLNAFVRLEGLERTTDFADRLYREHQVAIAEGELFRMPGWARISVGTEPEKLRQALALVGTALEETPRTAAR